MEIFVTHYDWNEQFTSVEEMADGCSEGSEFSLVRLTVGGLTRYKIINGAPVAMSVSFPERASEVGRLIAEGEG